MMRLRNDTAGFTLIEVAIVLVILSVLAGSLLIPLSRSIQRAKVDQVERELTDEILPALMAYAGSRQAVDTVYLPCPDCRDDGSACPGGDSTAGDGIEDRDGDECSVTWGVLPWVTLQGGFGDPWGARYSYAVFDYYADSGPENGIHLNYKHNIDPTPDLYITTLDGADADTDDDGLAGSSGSNTSGGDGDNGVSAVIISHGPNRLGAMSIYPDADGNGVAFDAPPVNSDEEKNSDGDDVFFWRPPTDPVLSDIEEFDDIVVWLSTHRLRAFLADTGRLP